MKVNINTLRRRARQAGLTLIELLVVLVILTAIGGLLVPTITSALSRSHVATCAQTFPEVHQMIQRAQLESGSFGTGFDSGIQTATTTSVNGASTAALTGPEAAALNAVGITSVVDHDPADADYNVTFNIGATARDITAGGTPAAPTAPTAPNLITLTQAQAQAVFLEHDGTGHKYVWLGIGRNWSLLGNLAPEPPAHFGDTPGALPDEVHSRFGIILQVAEPDGSGGSQALEAAEFKRVSYTLDGTNFETADNHLEVYWEELNES